MSRGDRGNGRSESRGRDAKGRRRWAPHPSLLFLLLGAIVLVVVAFQAYDSVRSHRATVDKVLTDHAATAAWMFEQRTHRGMTATLDHLFHALHDVPSDSVRDRAPAADLVLHDPHDEASCGYIDLGLIPYALRFSASGGPVEVAGDPPETSTAAERRRIADAVRQHVRTGEPVFRTEGALGLDLRGGPRLVGYSRQLVGRDTVLYALAFDRATIDTIFRQAVGEAPLLPEPLVAGLDSEGLLAVRVEVPGSGVIYGASTGFPTRHIARRPIWSEQDGLVASVGLRGAAAEHLVIGGLPRSRLPLLLGLLALAIGLMVVAFLQLRREHALARLRADFVSSVSHELRTPLALQRVFVDMLKLGRVRDEDKRRWAIDNIDRETERLTGLVENVLRFSRAGQGHLSVDPVPTELAGELRSVVQGYAPLAEPRGVRLALEMQEGVVAPADRDALRQVMRNLLENAVKYGPRGGAVTVGLRQDGDRAVITVDDEGPGVPADERESIWEPFHRGDAAARTGSGGSGIGLSVVREIVELHDGAVAVDDAPGGGARFRIELQDARRGTPSSARAPVASGSGDAAHEDGARPRPAVSTATAGATERSSTGPADD